MPKNTKTDINVRYGEIKMADAFNVKATLNHTPFTADRIDGVQTLINASYAPCGCRALAVRHLVC